MWISHIYPEVLALCLWHCGPQNSVRRTNRRKLSLSEEQKFGDGGCCTPVTLKMKLKSLKNWVCCNSFHLYSLLFQKHLFHLIGKYQIFFFIIQTSYYKVAFICQKRRDLLFNTRINSGVASQNWPWVSGSFLLCYCRSLEFFKVLSPSFCPQLN